MDLPNLTPPVYQYLGCNFGKRAFDLRAPQRGRSAVAQPQQQQQHQRLRNPSGSSTNCNYDSIGQYSSSFSDIDDMQKLGSICPRNQRWSVTIPETQETIRMRLDQV